ncbi:FG-GAP repeat domain-containing protein [Streptomyces sp. NPDC056049]|uniref:FG-GAP repeat domain-containing protein n=1 Tax=Streptomyces sp. NPDC056049 TaxID=3345693 RepID=UPI0035DE8E51
MQFRTTGPRHTRLAAAVTAVLAVTALGAGTLATAPAAFAETAPTAPAAVTGLPVLPASASVLAAGPSGFLVRLADEDLLWTPYDGGATTRIDGSLGWASSGDVVAVGHSHPAPMTRFTLRDMAASTAQGVTIDLEDIGGTFISVLGRNSVLAEVARHDGTVELHVVTKDGDVVRSEKVSGLPASAGFFRSSGPVRDGFAVVSYTSGDTAEYNPARALVDLGKKTVVTSHDAPGDDGSFSGGLMLSASHVAWLEAGSGDGWRVVSVDRATGERKTTQLGYGTYMKTALVGDWLLYGAHGEPATAVSLTGAGTRQLTTALTGLVAGSDGRVVADGTRAQDGEGLFRITAATGGEPVVTKIADRSPWKPVTFTGMHVPKTAQLDRTGGKVTLGWTLSTAAAYLDVTLTHVETGRTLTTRVPAPDSGTRFSFDWDGTIGKADGPYGTYVVKAVATPTEGDAKPTVNESVLTIERDFNAHDFIGNGSTDVLARDASGVLWLEDLRDRPVDGKVQAGQRIRIGAGWNTYKQIEAAGDLGGSFVGDALAVDGSGVLWAYDGRGVERETFGARVRVGGGWDVYKQLAGGSDLDGDTRPDLVATDGAGVLWFYKGTGNLAKPFGARVRVGGGWGVYNELAAVGNIAGTAAGDLVARDTAGVLWLYQGDGQGKFLPRVKVGGGWNAFSRLVGAGDVDGDGRPDLLAYGAGGTYVYRSNGTVASTFTRLNTSLFTGEGGKFTSVA